MFDKEEILKDWEMKLVWDAAFSDGMAEVEKKIAKALKDNQVDVKVIIATTGLSEADIEKL